MHRPSVPDQIYAAYFMPRDSPAGLRWVALADELARGKRLQGILPVEDVLLYGQKSILLIAHFQMTKSAWSGNIRHALEHFTCAFEALSSAHSKGISINLWPERPLHCHEASFADSYVCWADDPTVKDWTPHGSTAPSDEQRFAPIAGRRFPRRFVTRFPPQPSYASLIAHEDGKWSGPWTPYKASRHPLVPCTPLVS